jgi:hypothetical protein
MILLKVGHRVRHKYLDEEGTIVFVGEDEDGDFCVKVSFDNGECYPCAPGVLEDLCDLVYYE